MCTGLRGRVYATASLTLAMTAIGGVGWTQPPTPPEEKAPTGRINIEQLRERMKAARKPRVLFDQFGNGITRLPPAPPVLKREGGELALSDKFVFVLLNGTLYQYDIDTLALRNQVKVGGAGPQAQATVRIVPQPRAEARPGKGAWLGITLREAPDGEGAQVGEVVVDSPADVAGLETGDLLARYNGQPVESPDDLIRKVAAADVGEDIQVEIIRGKEKKTVTIKTGKLPDFLTPQAPGAIEVQVETPAEAEVKDEK